MDLHTVDYLRAVEEKLAAKEEEVRFLRNAIVETHGRLERVKINALKGVKNEESTTNNREKYKLTIIKVKKYKRTIKSLMKEKDTNTKKWAEERSKLIQERDITLTNLASMELAINGAYEKSKKVKDLFEHNKRSNDDEDST